MKRSELASLLSHDGEVFALCREALVSGADFEIWPGPVERVGLTNIYARRAALARKKSLPSIGMDAAAEALAAGNAEVALGYVDDRPADGFYFQLFLAADLSKVVACLGVRGKSSQ